MSKVLNVTLECVEDWYFQQQRPGAQCLVSSTYYSGDAQARKHKYRRPARIRNYACLSGAFSSMIGSRDSFPGSWDHEAQAPVVTAYSKVSRCLKQRAMEEYSFANSSALEFPIHVKMFVLSSKLPVYFPNQTLQR